MFDVDERPASRRLRVTQRYDRKVITKVVVPEQPSRFCYTPELAVVHAVTDMIDGRVAFDAYGWEPWLNRARAAWH